MFRQMRRIKQLLQEDESIEILKKCDYGQLSLIGDDDYPYIVPLNYVYDDGKIYFHSGKIGHKIDAINKNEKCSFCVVEKDDIVREEYTTYFRSVIAFGKIKIINDDIKKAELIKKLAMKYFKEDSEENRNKHIDKSFPALCIMQMSIEHITGKEAIELVRMRNK
ncbi:MAG: pyridoxamine 5'-phosphate oxidase family protein [Peptostreptococcaceae bacterium]|nr:pyridoxamine 5'-phosphate oxidase family protein [Peptostreptococcaceae bacterium]